MESILRALSWVAEEGIRVFPLVPGSKEPLAAGFQGHATRDEDLIEQIWTGQPSSGVGVMPEKGKWVCIDIDIGKGNQPSGYDQLMEAGLSDVIDTGFSYDTPSGGQHTWFRVRLSYVTDGYELVGGCNKPCRGVDIRYGHDPFLGSGGLFAKAYADGWGLAEAGYVPETLLRAWESKVRTRSPRPVKVLPACAGEDSGAGSVDARTRAVGGTPRVAQYRGILGVLNPSPMALAIDEFKMAHADREEAEALFCAALDRFRGWEVEEKSGELHGPCFACGTGEDRLVLLREPKHDDFPWAWCRQCETGFDLVALGVIAKYGRMAKHGDVPEFLKSEGFLLARGGSDAPTFDSEEEEESEESEEGSNPSEMATPPDLSEYALTDTGNAERVARVYGSRIRWVPERSAWAMYDRKTGTWALDVGLRLVRRYIVLTARAFGKAAEKKLSSPEVRALAIGDKATLDVGQAQDLARAEACVKWAKASESARGSSSCEVMMRSLPGMTRALEEFDADPLALCVANGVVHIEKAARGAWLEAHSSEAYCMLRVPIEWRADALAPTWERTIHECMGSDLDLVGMLRRAAGYSSFGSIVEQKVFVLYGSGGNGKTVFSEAMRWSSGEYGIVASADTVLASRNRSGEGPTENVACLAGARFVSVEEPDRGRRLDEARIKAITGGDRVRARYLRENSFTFTPRFKLWISANHEPRVVGTDDGIWRRLCMIPFAVSFIGREDRELPAKLKEEAEGILAWRVRGAVEWLREGLNAPERVGEATRRYRANQDDFGRFLRESVEESEGAEVVGRALMDAYRAWCVSESIPQLSGREYREALMARGYIVRKTKKCNMWVGIRLRGGGTGFAH